MRAGGCARRAQSRWHSPGRHVRHKQPSLTWRALPISSGRCSSRAGTPMSAGLLMTVSMRSALPSFRYCFTRLCLKEKSIFTSVPGEILARNGPLVRRGPRSGPGGEHRGDLLGPSDTDVVGDERLEEAPRPARVVEDQGAGDLHLAHRQLPPVAGGAVGGTERDRDHRRPPVEERLRVGRPETVADRLQPGRSGQAAKPLASDA